MTGSAHRAPIAAVLIVFAASRVGAWAAGVRFDSSPLPLYWQYIDPTLLEKRLLQSLWYLDAQPPLYNLFLGLDLKLFGSSYGIAAHVVQIAAGVAITLSLYALLVALGVRRWLSAAAAALFVVSPEAILYENWLFYEYLVAAILLLAVLSFVGFERRPTARRAFAVFVWLAVLCFTRASFQILVMLLVLAFMLAVFPGRRRAIVLGALLPFALVLGLMLKNWVLFGTPSTSSWVGMNLMEVAQSGYRGDDKDELQQQRVISAIARIPVFKPLSAYRAVIPPDHRFRGIPVLAEGTKPSSGLPNFNNIEYVAISNRDLHEFVQIVLHRPSIYFRGVWRGLQTEVYPSSEYFAFIHNRAKIEPYVRAYNGLVLWQPRVRWVDSAPAGTAWGLVAFYGVALLYGGLEFSRVLFRRGGSATLALTWMLLAYTTVVTTLGEVRENQRIRFVGDPLVVLLVVVLASRLAVPLRHSLSLGPLRNGAAVLRAPSPKVVLSLGIAVVLVGVLWVVGSR